MRRSAHLLLLATLFTTLPLPGQNPDSAVPGSAPAVAPLASSSTPAATRPTVTTKADSARVSTPVSDTLGPPKAVLDPVGQGFGLVLASVLMVGGLGLLTLAVQGVKRGGVFAIESHWGGFGGGLGGWRFSAPLVYLFAGLALLLMLVMLSATLLRPLAASQAKQPRSASAPAPTAARSLP